MGSGCSNDRAHAQRTARPDVLGASGLPWKLSPLLRLSRHSCVDDQSKIVLHCR
jgi:hypothetical protein